MQYKYLNEFINIYPDYELNDVLKYNSYRSGIRSEVRDYDSISITEILSLIIDKNMEIVFNMYEDKMKTAMDYGTYIHKQIEDNIKSKEEGIEYVKTSDPLLRNYKLFTIKYGVTDMLSEISYNYTYKQLPIVTGTIDCICNISEEKYLLDWKTTKNKRSFKSVKYNLQLAGYRWLSKINKSAIVYLNSNGYEFNESDNHDYWDNIWSDLIEYANDLYLGNKINNLYLIKK